MRTIDKSVTVLSTDPWLDRLHGTSVLGLFKSLAKLGYRVNILLPSVSKGTMKDGFLSVICLHVERDLPFFTLVSLYRRALKHVLKEKSPVLIFDHSMLPLFFLTKIFRRSKGVMLILSRPVAEKGFFGWLHFSHFRLSLMLSRSFVDKFTAISPFEAREFSKLGGVPTGKITVIPSTISESFERFALPKNIEELRLKLGLNALFGKKVVIYHGVLDEKKGVMKLVHIFNESFRDNNNIVLLIVGDGPARTAIEHWIGHNRVENIILLGRLPTSKVPEVVAAIDVGIILHPNHPWWRYQCNIKMIELLFMGKPILVSDLPGLRWIGANSPLVTYLNQSDPYSFKEESIKLISNLEQIAVHAADARQEMMNRFSSKAVAFRLKRLIDSLQASQ